MSQLITLNNIDSAAVDSLAALATDNTTLDGVTTLGAATEITSLPTFVLSIMLAEQAKIQASDAQAADLFGFSVSISSDGNTAIVGAGSEDAGGFNAGAAYIFVRSGSTWTQQAKILSSDSQDYDYIGRQVSISSDGNIAIIGAYGEDTGGSEAGAAYIFTRSGVTWSQQAKIQASDKEASDEFGCSVSISSDGLTAIVGARRKGTGASGAGAAYIFTRSGTSWTQQAKIISSDIQDYDQFGQSVSISSDGNTVIVGANLEDTGGSAAGAAYIFVRSGTSWTQQAKIQASDKEVSDNLGYSVSISSDGLTAIVGARYEDTGASDAGAAYIFVRSGSTWTQQAKIQASDKEASDDFGFSVSISGDGNTVIVGADGEDTGGSEAGAAYIFTRSGTTWTETQKIRASNTSTTAQFGYSVSISSDGNTAIVGAAFEDPSELDVGAAYIYAAEVISAVLSFDMSQSSIFSHSGLSTDFTANFTNVPTINNRTISAALILEQGATGYLPTVVQIDGVDQTILWQGAVVPVPSINASDIVRFTLLRFEGAWTVLASLIKFGSV